MKNKYLKAPELLSPAGNFEKLKAALLYGADAVYLAGQSFGMRSAADNFSVEELNEAVKYTHERGKRLFLTLNTMPHGNEYAALRDFLREIKDFGIDAYIVADLGVMATLREIIPDAEIHVSTQASIVSPEAAMAYVAMGAKRLVLARELDLEEIKAIRLRIPQDVELEAFIHGSMCVSYSGRCMLSNMMTGRDANRGRCTQPCRWNYVLYEEKRPDVPIPIEQSELGTFIMSSKDMCTIEHLQDLMDAGIDCIKIEGRAKSAYYAAIVTGAYRHCIDDLTAGRPMDPVWMDEVNHVSHRNYSTGFYYGFPGQYTESSRYIRQWQIAAIVESCDETGLAQCSLRNKFSAGAQLEIVGPDFRPMAFTPPVMEDMEGNPLDEPRTPEMKFKLQLPCSVPAFSILRKAVDLSAK